MQIQVGNFNQTIATLQLGGSETAIIVSIVICSVLLLLSVVGKEPTLVTPWREGLPLKMGRERHSGLGLQLEQGLGVEISPAPRGGGRGVLGCSPHGWKMLDVGRMCWAKGSSARQKSFKPCFPGATEGIQEKVVQGS